MIKEYFADIWEEIKIWWYVPPRCRGCEIMGLCRTGKKYSCGPRGCVLLWEKEQDAKKEKEG